MVCGLLSFAVPTRMKAPRLISLLCCELLNSLLYSDMLKKTSLLVGVLTGLIRPPWKVSRYGLLLQIVMLVKALLIREKVPRASTRACLLLLSEW